MIMIGRKLNHIFGIVLALVFIWHPNAAQSQSTSIVRAGEHASYSRIVVPAGSDAAWELRTSGRRSTFAVSNSDTNYDVSSVFDRIPRTRILAIDTSVSGESSTISISLGCDCVVEAKLSGNFVVIDVKDPNAEPAGIAEQQMQEPGKTKKTEISEEQSGETAVADERVSSSSSSTTSPTNANQLNSVLRPNPSPARNASAIEKNDITQKLIKQLEAAAAQGIVNLSPELVDRGQPLSIPSETIGRQSALTPNKRKVDGLEDMAPRIEARAKEAEESLPESLRITLPPSNIGSSNSLRSPKKKVKEENEENANCISDAEIDVANWVEDDNISDQITALRARLFGEFDRVDPFALRDLSRLYISIGFGVEVIALLSDIESSFEGRELLLELAAAAEDRVIETGGRFDLTAGCKGRVELWRAIVVDRNEQQPIEKTDGILREFSILPLEVRRRYGPRLVRSFINRNQLDAARASFAILDRAVGPHGEMHEFMRARLFEASGDLATAEDVFVDLFRQNKATAPAALLRLVNLYAVQGKDISVEMISDLEVFAFELKDEQIGRELRLAEIRSKAGNRNLGAALDVVQKEISKGERDSSPYFQAADQILLEASFDQIGPGPFVEAIFSHLQLVMNDGIKSKTKIHIADEMLKLGLPASAIEFAKQSAQEIPAQAVRIIASALLQLDEAETSLQALAEGDAELQHLEYKALTSLGRYHEAQQTRKTSILPDDPYVAWRAGNWVDASSVDDAELAVLASYMTAGVRSQVNAPSSDMLGIGDEVSLLGANKFVKDSELTRSLLSSLINRY